MRQAPDAILIVDAEGHIESANPAVHRITGVYPSRLVGESVFRPELFSERGLGAARARFEKAMAGTTAEPFEFELVRSDGETVVVEATCHRVEWARRPCLEMILRDISSRRRVERERLSMAEQMTFSQKMEAVGQLAGGVAHDFNNLLTVVGGSADLIDEDPSATDSILELTREIRDAQQQASMLTRRLLAFAQKQIFEAQPMSLGDEVSEMEELIRSVVGGGVVLTMQVTDEDTTVIFDRHQIEQLLVNFASNARDAMGARGSLSIFVDAVTLDAPLLGHAGAIGPGEYAVLTVKDDGRGIRKDLQSKIFEPFFTTKIPRRASGLGLSAILGIVRQADGQIVLSSAPGKGARFSVYIPKLVVTQPH
jgi:PAS domain S-box-containing protein